MPTLTHTVAMAEHILITALYALPLLALLGVLLALWLDRRNRVRQEAAAARHMKAEQRAAMHRALLAAELRARERACVQRAGRPAPRPTAAPAPYRSTSTPSPAPDVTQWPMASAYGTPAPASSVAAPAISGGGGDFAGAGASGDWRCESSPASDGSTSASDGCGSSD